MSRRGSRLDHGLVHAAGIPQKSWLLLPGGRCPCVLALVHATGNGLISFLGL